MRKFILTLFVLAALSILAVLVAGLEGRLRVTLMGFDVATELSVAVGALLAAATVLVIVVLTAQYLWHLPARLHARRTMARQRMGTQALAEALMALARGDAEGARAGVDLARRKLPHEPLPLLVAAQTDILAGDAAAAEGKYRLMAGDPKNPAISKLGLEGLFYLARMQNPSEAEALAHRALAQDAKASWALEGLMALAVQYGDWDTAERWLRRWARSGAGRKKVNARRAVIYAAAAQALAIDDNAEARRQALKKAEQASAAAPDLVPATALKAQLQARAGNHRKARKTLRDAWARCPHPNLGDAWLAAHADQPAASRLRLAAQMVRGHDKHIEAHIFRARVACSARRYSFARKLLEPIWKIPTGACVRSWPILKPQKKMRRARASGSTRRVTPRWKPDGRRVGCGWMTGSHYVRSRVRWAGWSGRRAGSNGSCTDTAKLHHATKFGRILRHSFEEKNLKKK